MRLRFQSKLINGKLRWYIVRSYRDLITKKPRVAHCLYLGIEPNKKIRILLDRVNDSLSRYGPNASFAGKDFERIRGENLKQRKDASIEVSSRRLAFKLKRDRELNASVNHQSRLARRRELYSAKFKSDRIGNKSHTMLRKTENIQ